MARHLMRGMPTGRACLLVRRRSGVGKVTGQNAPFRHVAAPGRCGATARQAAGRVASGPADLGLESELTKRRTLPNLRAADCAFP